MLPISQQKKDDCFQAAIASILELDLKDIPAYNEEETKNWYNEEGEPVMVPGDYGFNDYMTRLNDDFLAPLNLSILHITFSDNSLSPPGLSIANMKVMNENDKAKGLNHAVVVYNGNIVFDPSSKRNIRKYEKTGSYFIFQNLDPAVGKE